MTILFLGNFQAEFSSENYYKKTLQKFGIHVICLQEGSATAEIILDVLTLNKVDYFFWVHTHGWRIEGIEAVLHKLRMNNIPSFAYHLDLYLGIQRQNILTTSAFFKVDHFFTVDKLMADWLNENTKCKGHFMPAGVFEDDCNFGIANPDKYPHEIIFTGSSHPYHPEWPYRTKLVNWLKETYGDRFGHYGGGGMPPVRGPELNNLYASAKIVVGDTLCKGFTYPWYSSDRLFEVTGRGGFLIYPSIQGLPSFYRGNSEVVFYDFDNFDMLKGLIDYYLSNQNAREGVRLGGFLRAQTEHTYTHRLKAILEILEHEKK